MRSDSLSPLSARADKSFANAKTPSPIVPGGSFGTGPVCLSDEAYHGVVLASAIRAGVSYLRVNGSAFGQKFGLGSVRGGAFGGTR